MEVSQIIELMAAVKENELTDFSYEENGMVLKIKKHSEKQIISPMPMAMPVGQPAAMPVQAEPVMIQAGEYQASQTPAQTAAEESLTGNVVKCPLVGTFYAASSPDAAPYVKVGDVVSKGQVLGIVEAMKLMNEIESEYAGTVKQILVNNGEVVEYDQPMFVIE